MIKLFCFDPQLENNHRSIFQQAVTQASQARKPSEQSQQHHPHATSHKTYTTPDARFAPTPGHPREVLNSHPEIVWIQFMKAIFFSVNCMMDHTDSL